MPILDSLRTWLRQYYGWLRFQDINREGWRNAWVRSRIVPQILRTAPVRTRPPDEGTASGAEVHVLLWDRDYLNGLWAAKSFYAASGVDWPLYWHQGGRLGALAKTRLRAHFPDSRLIDTATADGEVQAALDHLRLPTCWASRTKAFMLRKLIDPVVIGRAEYLLLLDTDILFFATPQEMLDTVADRTPISQFNRDIKSWYNITPADAKSRYGIDLLERINAGCGLVPRASIDLGLLEQLLADPDMHSIPWLTEQTAQALLASKFGVRHLPDTYLVATTPGLTTADGRPLIAKHYPGHPRRYLYQEGMPQVLSSGLLKPTRGG